ncbi:WXG100 family type VII secretion target [Nocardia brevicatena]|uniref:WXG100 family type VII secretion target n=1 Tax=Nocardia brevicatena TaxID=37327 RepID=UPI0003007765|nr:WXG100 family type VII secretion target [Nocardia brevicatena]
MSMKYSEGQLLAMTGDIRTSKGRISESHGELLNYVNQLASSWESDEAKIAYDAKQNRWNKAHEDLMDIMERIAKVVEDGAINMTTTDKQNASRWL